MHTVAVCGTGYVGIVTAACFASFGNDVVAYDTDVTKIERLRGGTIPLHEPGLEAIVQENVHRGRLRFTSSPAHALDGREIVFIAVGTPVGPLGDADLTYVRQAARDIARHAAAPMLVVNKSTVPVETSDLVARVLEREARGGQFRVASNPEFLREGTAVADFMHPDRIVIGADDPHAASLLRDLYRPVDAPVVVVDTRTAEMIKYAANAFLATKLSFVNELSNLCEAVGAGIDDVLSGIAYDRRIGRAYMQPGLGFGGSCLPKDVRALSAVARAHAIEPTLLDAVLAVNARQVSRAVAAIEHTVGELDGRKVTVLGLAFKPDTDDVRSSPAVALAHALASRGARVAVHDPAARAGAERTLRDRVDFYESAEDALAAAEAVVVATPWDEYQALPWRALHASLKRPIFFDLRNAFDAAAMRSNGFEYHGIARPMHARAIA
jgi:UDPglucose 6-dehydrogenase